MDNSFEDWVGQIKRIGKKVCKDCKMIKIPEDKEYCSFCDPNEFMGGYSLGADNLATNPVPAGVDPFQEGYEMGYQKAKSEDSMLRSLDNYNENPFKFVVIEGLVTSHIYRMEHETNARLALDELIDWHCTIALDRRVSEQAEELYQQGVRDAEKPNLFFVWLSVAVMLTIVVAVSNIW